ncbi:ferritin-like domain-containing protein [Niabella yanshanensis]|uniref:Ferritin-like domain-containing protein n=1 Tax=Niabella yanshanensis TaxID=577386 RepID=A0ABZ0W538_9BACT|nr:ferritin-like domain-containing protein [Niabella yanshanensis]WQD37664.1 ferritin-like domain-containing protein [Niabella yanshanensis]
MKSEQANLTTAGSGKEGYNRRKFLSALGLGTAGAAVLSSCGHNDWYDQFRDGNKNGGATLDFKDDIGILNYAYALEQLEAAFYTEVVAKSSSVFSASQNAFFNDIKLHEIAHREFFKKALGSNAIGNLEVDFSSVNFSSKDSVLATAKAFEDLGVAAYNGAGYKIMTEAYLVIAGQIVSVEARHAAWIRDQISNGSFSDLNSLTALGADNSKGLDAALPPSKVLPIAATYIKTKIDVKNVF